MASRTPAQTSCLGPGTLEAEAERRFLLGGVLGENFLETWSERHGRKHERLNKDVDSAGI